MQEIKDTTTSDWIGSSQWYGPWLISIDVVLEPQREQADTIFHILNDFLVSLTGINQLGLTPSEMCRHVHIKLTYIWPCRSHEITIASDGCQRAILTYHYDS